ncbi:MAG: DUF5050 domain-containing protein [Thermotaleaceae bacterium]
MIIGDWIFYQNASDGGRLYKIKTDGSQRTKITEDQIGNINVYGDVVFAIDMNEDGIIDIFDLVELSRQIQVNE